MLRAGQRLSAQIGRAHRHSKPSLSQKLLSSIQSSRRCNHIATRWTLMRSVLVSHLLAGKARVGTLKQAGRKTACLFNDLPRAVADERSIR